MIVGLLIKKTKIYRSSKGSCGHRSWISIVPASFRRITAVKPLIFFAGRRNYLNGPAPVFCGFGSLESQLGEKKTRRITRSRLAVLCSLPPSLNRLRNGAPVAHSVDEVLFFKVSSPFSSFSRYSSFFGIFGCSGLAIASDRLR